jgi:hypothetical protein
VPVPHRKHHERVRALRERYNHVAGADWPTFEIFYSGKETDNPCMKEISDMGLVEWRDGLLHQRGDVHPTPNEHLEYLKRLNITVTEKQRQYSQHWTDQLLSHQPFDFETQLPKRL